METEEQRQARLAFQGMGRDMSVLRKRLDEIQRADRAIGESNDSTVEFYQYETKDEDEWGDGVMSYEQEEQEIAEMVRQHKSTMDLILCLRVHIMHGISNLVSRLARVAKHANVPAGFVDQFPMPTWMDVASRSGKTVELSYVKHDCIGYRQIKDGSLDRVTELSYRAMDIDDLSVILEYLQENYTLIRDNIKYANRNKS